MMVPQALYPPQAPYPQQAPQNQSTSSQLPLNAMLIMGPPPMPPSYEDVAGMPTAPPTDPALEKKT